MPQITLKGGFYKARSLIANAQRCVNLYPEKNPEDAEAPTTLYPTPGLTELAQGETGPWRGLYLATNDKLYGVLNSKLYSIAADWALAFVGNVTADLTTPVGIGDNGIDLVVVDGSLTGYTCSVDGIGFRTLTAADNYLGSTNVSYLDTFMLFNQPGTKNFYSTLSNVLTIDPLYIAAKTGFPDKLVSQVVFHREIWLIGARTTEVWYNAGSANFPFQLVPGVFIQHGCIARYSVATHDLMVFWLGLDADGQKTVFMGSGYVAKRVSTPAIAAELSKYALVSDAVGMCYGQQDHVFYMLTFPNAGKTWVYDVSENEWHERMSLDAQGIERRHRANCMTQAYGQVVVGDYINGKLYAFDQQSWTDDGAPIVRRRSFPHLVNDGNRVAYDQFKADVQCGDAPISEADNLLYLRWSDDRGRTFSNAVAQSLGVQGAYLAQPSWQQLGMARDRVFELFWSCPFESAANGAFIRITPAAT